MMVMLSFLHSGGRRGTGGLSSGIGRSGRSGRRQPATTGGTGHSSANSGESPGDEDDDI